MRAKPALTHGMRFIPGTKKASPTYISWQEMKSRCHNPNGVAYPRYGGRGITVCKSWHAFEAFFADMGERPQAMSLDRIDSNGNYEPGNCRWATRAEQSRNRCTSRFITINGQTHTIEEWGRVSGLGDTFRYRLTHGWTAERALSEPVNKRKSRAALPVAESRAGAPTLSPIT